MIESWGNDYLLISDYKEGKRCMYAYNQITKEGSYLPKCNASCGGSCTSDCGVAVSFNGFKGIYKVVHLFMGPPIECHILILRRDIVSSKWKKIQVPCINGERLLSGLPVSVQGRYIHWDVRSDKRLFSIDMVKEEIADISLPLPDNDCYTIFEMGGALAFCTENARDKADKDFQRNTWEKLQSVTLEKWYDKRFPVCRVMTSNKYIILECKHDKGMCYYDMKTGHVKKLAITIDFDEGCMFHSSPPPPSF